MNTAVDTALNAAFESSIKFTGHTEQRALRLLGSGCGPEQVAAAVGVSVSRISQLLSDPEFAAAVAELRFEALQKHNEIDSSYDEMEAKMLATLKDVAPLIMRPMEILKALSVLNAAKRRGQSAPESITNQNTIVNLTMPTMLVQRFSMNINNQVISAGEQTLETIQGSSLLKAAKTKQLSRIEGTIGEQHDGNDQKRIN